MHNTLLALTASLAATASATYQGFNYGATFTDGSAKGQSDFQADFQAAQKLAGTNGAFTSARLYTTIAGGTTNTPTGAIPAAIATKTTLLLGLWASGGQTGIDNELAALTSAIQQYGQEFVDLIAAISVGSEDLYRISPTGVENKSGVGAEPSDLVNYIGQVRKALQGTAASGKMVGHVDTWTAWVNGSNAAVAEACDFVGMDAYPYFQSTEDNSIQNSKSDFFSAYSDTQAASNGKPVWITETGFPVSGPTANLAVPSIANAKTYWDQVACTVLGNVNTWWFTLQDADPTIPSPSFGLVGTNLNGPPLYDLTCPKGAGAGGIPTGGSSSPTSSASSPSRSSSGGSGSGSGSSSGSGTGTSTATTDVGSGSSSSDAVSSATAATPHSSSSMTLSTTDSSIASSTPTATGSGSSSSGPGSGSGSGSGSSSPAPTAPNAGSAPTSTSMSTGGAAAPAATAGVMMGVVALAAGLVL